MTLTIRNISTFFVIILKKCLADRCSTLAAALSFSTFFSIIPFFAIIFSIFKALSIDAAITPLLLSNLTGGSLDLILKLMKYIHNTNVASLGIVGFALVMISIATTLDTVEEAFNIICGIEKGKAAHHKILDYLIIIISAPICIAIAVMLATSLQNQVVVQWLLQTFGIRHLILLKTIPFFSIWIATTLLYYFIPNKPISLNHAVIGGAIATVLQQTIESVYLHFQLGVSGYNAIYGTLSILPVFMVWIYTSWMVLLLGLEGISFWEDLTAIRKAAPENLTEEQSANMG